MDLKQVGPSLEEQAEQYRSISILSSQVNELCCRAQSLAKDLGGLVDASDERTGELMDAIAVEMAHNGIEAFEASGYRFRLVGGGASNNTSEPSQETVSALAVEEIIEI